jgi:catechol 2,3-dioxygenase-like lactoylglutathione lyase family enzyme
MADRSPPSGAPGLGAFGAEAVTHLLVVGDPSASKDWYVRCLDASVYGEYGGTSVVLQLSGSWLLLVSVGDPTPDKPTVAFRPPEDRDVASAEIIFRVGDCRATYELLASRGVEFLTEPYDWGSEIRAFFTDPDGHLFEISERT